MHGYVVFSVGCWSFTPSGISEQSNSTFDNAPIKHLEARGRKMKKVLRLHSVKLSRILVNFPGGNKGLIKREQAAHVFVGDNWADTQVRPQKTINDAPREDTKRCVCVRHVPSSPPVYFIHI